MNDKQIKALLADLLNRKGENEWIEVKENNHDPHVFGELISSISNAACLAGVNHGYILFGINDLTFSPVGTSFDPDTAKTQGQNLIHWLTQSLEPKVNITIYRDNSYGVIVIILEITAATDRPVAFKNVEYIRIGSIRRKLKDFPDKERQIWQNINRRNFEKNISITGLSDDEILELIDYAVYLELTQQSLSDKKAILDKLEQDRLITKSRGLFDITNLGALLFAKDLDKFETVARKAVRVIIYGGTDKVVTLKEHVFKKGYASSFSNIVQYINDQVPANEEIERALRVQKKMYPEAAIRELVANALIHQDFNETGTGPMIELFQDRIEISNPGIPLISTDRFIDHSPQSRNESLAAFMRRINICEERGSGIDKVIYFIEIFQLPAPKFEAGNNFTKITIYSQKPFAKMSKLDKIRACYQHCVLKFVKSEYMTNTTLRERFQIKESNYSIASRIIKATIEKGLIKLSDPEKSRSKGTSKYIPFWS